MMTPSPRTARRAPTPPGRQAASDARPPPGPAGLSQTGNSGSSGLSNRKQRVIAIVITVYALLVPMVLLLIELAMAGVNSYMNSVLGDGRGSPRSQRQISYEQQQKFQEFWLNIGREVSIAVIKSNQPADRKSVV